MGLSDLIQINISVTSPHVTQAGFGTPLILSTKPAWAERTRVYTNPDAVLVDFGANDPEYLAAAAIFSQEPQVERIKIGRGANKATQRFNIVPTVLNATHYILKLIGPDGVEHTADYLSDANATAQEIIDGLKALIDPFGLAVTTSNQGPNTSLRILANVAGVFFSVEATDPSLLLVEQDHADPGVAADLAAIALADDDWYAFVTLFNSTALVTAAAAWAETKVKLYLAQSQQGDILTASAADIASVLKGLAYKRSAAIYHPKTRAFIDAALLGARLPYPPGSETWMYATLAGVPMPALSLTPDQRTKALGKNANIYETVAGLNITEEGKTAGGQFIDITRGIDWLKARIQERVFASISSQPKVPYTDPGVAMISADVRAQLQEGVDVGLLAADPKPTVTQPKVADANPVDKSARLLRNLKFKATGAGALHKFVLDGNVSF